MLVALLLVFSTQAAHAQFTRHHIGINIGYFKAFSDDLKEEAIGWDLTNGGLGAFNYRYSFNPIIDMAIESRAWVATDEVLGVISTSIANSFLGIGVRFNAEGMTVRPYIQGNIYMVTENGTVEVYGIEADFTESGVGFGVNGGMDITAQRPDLNTC